MADLTVAEYLAHIAESLVDANVAAMKAIRNLLGGNDLDIEIPLGGQVVELDGTTLTPEGFFLLDELEIECESQVEVARDGQGEPTGLAMVLRRGLMRRGMHVKFKAKFKRDGRVEAIEILRDAGNEALRKSLAGSGISITTRRKE